ncbi:TlpA family protein disulfide reductase [Aestuariirhabdus litorea]|uniref:TlpA family protein disulfide reductase n=1 Tax=Aestuariirhabdus litorea TaxID=2528527 RepID=A0A3P3VRL6_9GAMM|nr:TlpA disulfide reductase family protein [Aestuariirhabdus litorea]RRJ85270.1 TlpA family protein disulfide reductase [Aestuariirhabdus litorea]RWW98492.1 redoxin domain-containing protein [Endozoicomonadaceae bacterium GTF-13]
MKTLSSAAKARRVMGAFMLGVVTVVALSYWHSREKLEASRRPLPNVELVRIDDTREELAELYGKPLLINFWASWCEPCREEMPALQRLKNRMEGRLRVIAISVDQDVNLIDEFNRRYELDFAPYWDPDSRLAEQLGIELYPTTLLVSAEGIWLDRVVGERHWDSEEMIDYINELNGGVWQ